MELGEIDSEYFHHPEKNPRVFGHQKHHEFTKKIFDHQKLFRSPTGHQVHSGCQVPSLTLRDIFNPNGCHISRSHQVHRGRQVPSLTPRNILCPNGRHVSRGCQVPSLTPRDTFCPDGRHVWRGRQVPSLTPCDTFALTIIMYQGVFRDLGIVKYLSWHCVTYFVLMVVTYQGVVRYPTYRLE